MKIDPKVLKQVAEHLGNYVYMLLDPRTSVPFYVGKGSRTRVADHGLEAEALSSAQDESPAEHSRKIRTIREIREAGYEPDVWILRYGMGSEYTQVEAAAIDLLSTFVVETARGTHPLANADQLTNERRESSKGHGIETLANIVTEFGAPQLQAQTPPLLLITLKPWVDLEEPLPGGGTRAGYGFRTEWLSAANKALIAPELGDSVRAWWRIDPKTVERFQIRHVVAVHRGVTRGLFQIRPDSWKLDTDTGRRGFSVDPVLSGQLYEEVIGRYGHRTPPKKRGDISSFTYWPKQQVG
ncbi:LEM-3-like GIY-YIG domain-containing protein [Paenarthrobacter sp. NPDC018779]|uniref:LEM-3-like GIY-YIG domain-containing protein n=1 Tax=Paenarthrobacter sp. NPDC018779 TaxID=3364375 RepID=UPI0037C99889